MSQTKAQLIEGLNINTSAPADALAIDSSGNVGIGTTSPHGNSGTNLHIHGSNTTAELRLTNTTTGTGANGSVIQQGGNTLYVSNSEAGNIAFENNGSERLRIDSSGNVGIGTTSPSAQIHLNQSGTGSYSTLRLSNSGASGRTYEIGVGGSTSGTGYAGNLYFYDSTASAIRAVIDSSGNVGIGTTIPGSFNSDGRNLVVGTGSGGQGMSIYSGNSSYGTIYFADGTSGDALYQGAVLYNHSSNFMRLDTAGAERMRIDSSGRVGIGTTSPGKDLEVYNTTGPSISLNDGGDYKSYFTLLGNDLELRGSSGNVEFYTGNADGASSTERMRIDSSGRLLLGLNSTANGHTLQVQASGGANAVSIIGRSVDDQSEITFYENDNSTILGQIQHLTTHATFRHRAGYLRFDSGGVNEKMRLDSSGQLGIGTSAPTQKLDVRGSVYVGTNIGINTTSPADQLHIHETSSGAANVRFSSADVPNGFFVGFDGQEIGQIWHTANKDIRIATNNTERMRIDNSGLLGVGVSSPIAQVQINSDKNAESNKQQGGNYHLLLKNDQDDTGEAIGLGFSITSNASAVGAAILHERDGGGSKGSLQFLTNGGSDTIAERMRIDNAGNLLIGTTSSLTQDAELRVAGSGVATAEFYNAGGCYNTWSSGSTATARGFIGVSNQLVSGGNGTDFCIRSQSNLNFAAGGNLTRLTIDSNGSFTNKSSNVGSVAGEGFTLGRTADSYLIVTRDSDTPLFLNRMNSDGNLVQFYAQTNLEGTISVSGNTVSYNGGHLARWSQLAGGAERTEILRGSVLSNLDEMCEWAHAAQDAVEAQDAVLYTEEDELPEGVSVGDVKTPAVEASPAVDAYTEDNEQLNRMKVSDVEGDRNVSGVFQAWDDDDDTYTNDFYCAMTGDFVIRIAQGTTVARGDLLMSAGDGTAKPQDDDIVRSKTIAKVTSTTVSTTYADGSYCVPCVLMAC